MANIYSFSARLKEDSAAQMVVASSSYRIFRIISLIIFGTLLTLIISSGLIDLAGGRGISWGMLIIVLVVFGLPIYFIVSTPLSHKIIINNVDNNLVLVVEYLFGIGSRPRVKEQKYQPEEITISRKTPSIFSTSIILVMRNQEEIIMHFQKRISESEQVANRINKLINRSYDVRSEENLANIVEAENFTDQSSLDINKFAYDSMQKEIRSWRGALIFFGVIDLLSSWSLDPSWGITLLIVAIASRYIREAPIFIVIAGIMALLALNNISGFDSFWLIFGGYQLYLSVRIFRKFKYFHQAETEYIAALKKEGGTPNFPVGRAQRLFPGVGCLISTLAFVAFFAIVIFGIMVGVLAAESDPSVADIPLADSDASLDLVINTVLGLLQSFGMIGFSMSVATIMAKFERKWMGIGGTIVGGLLMGIFVVLMFS